MSGCVSAFLFFPTRWVLLFALLVTEQSQSGPRGQKVSSCLDWPDRVTEQVRELLEKGTLASMTPGD